MFSVGQGTHWLYDRHCLSTGLTGGSGSVLDYANAARAAGLDFVIFLEQFDMLTPGGLSTLGNDCATHSDTNLGEEGDKAFHNIPILEFNDDQAIVVRSPLREVYDPNIPAVNAWHTYGPKDPSIQLTAVRRYTEFNRPLVGVRGTGWAAYGERTGAVVANFESDLTFLQNLTIVEMRLLRTIWYGPRPGTLVVGRTPPVEHSLIASSSAIIEQIDTGEWFGFYSTETYNNALFVNRAI